MIRGKRVILRPVEERDLDLLARWRNDPETRRLLFSPFLVNPGGQRKWYEALLANSNKILFMVDNLEGRTVGTIGMDKIDWVNQEFEGGPFIFDCEERSHGYAEEALELMINYAFEELNLHRMYVLCYPFQRAIEFMKWYGFKEEGVLRKAAFTQGRFYDKIILGLLREEWQEDRASDMNDD
jgi:RimJ/RimL family protein N-acetyltransferase